MNIKSIVDELQAQYPEKNIVYNPDQISATEILCEVEPTSMHPEFSCAIAVVDAIAPHYHNNTLEEYSVLKGTLRLQLGDEKIVLRKGDTVVIPEGTIHSGIGEETWIMCTSTPGWTLEDHIVVE